MTIGRVARAANAERDLASMATSPTVFAAVNRRSWSMATYPIRCYRGSQATELEPLDPARVPWVAAMLRLLETPNPADVGCIFPENPGEGVLAQIVADLLEAGNAYAAVQTNDEGRIIGLHRLHPQLVHLERRPTGDVWVYRPGYGSTPVLYPRGSVSHLRLLSWQKSAAGEMGVGAGTPLRPMVAAESEALQQTAASIEQGGPDIVITGKDAQTAAFMQSETNRKQIVERFTEKLKPGPDGKRRRIVALGGNLEIKDAGWKPADLKAPELLKASRSAELMAIGVTPISVGADAGTYANAVQQYRVQAEWDEQLQTVIEAYLLRPLARHMARQFGGRWAMRADQVTCRIDLSGHPGYAYLRTDAIKRAKELQDMGWTAEQAAAAEGLNLPKPEGKPMRAGPAAAPNAEAPRRPLGDAEGEGGDPGETEPAADDGERSFAETLGLRLVPPLEAEGEPVSMRLEELLLEEPAAG